MRSLPAGREGCMKDRVGLENARTAVRAYRVSTPDYQGAPPCAQQGHCHCAVISSVHQIPMLSQRPLFSRILTRGYAP